MRFDKVPAPSFVIRHSSLFPAAGEADGDVASLGDDEFFDFDGDALGVEFIEHHGRNFGSERFDEFPMAAVSKMEQAIGDRRIVDGVGEIITRGCGREVVVNLDGDEESLGLGALSLGDAHLEGDFEV